MISVQGSKLWSERTSKLSFYNYSPPKLDYLNVTLASYLFSGL